MKKQLSIKILFLIVLGLLIYFREPGFFLSPRIWAEEGALYFQYAYQHSWSESLFASQLGYYSLFANLSAVIAAKLIELEYVARFFLIASLSVQLIPFGIILLSTSDIWKNNWSKVLGMSIVLFTLMSGEIWLNTINSQFYFALVTFLILLDDENTLTFVKKWVYRLLLALSGLTGILSVFLLPVFLISGYWTQSKERLIQMGILLVSGIFQAAVFLSSFTQESLYYTRFQGFDLMQLPPIILLRSILLPLLGPDMSIGVFDGFIASNFESISMGLVSLLIITLFLYGFSTFIKTKERVLYIGAYLCLLVLSIVSALGASNELLSSLHLAQRYFYVPNVILVLMIFRNMQLAVKNKNRLMTSLCGLFVTLALVNGMTYFQYSLSYHSADPKWENEVQEYRSHSDGSLDISPVGWKIDVNLETGD